MRPTSSPGTVRPTLGRGIPSARPGIIEEVGDSLVDNDRVQECAMSPAAEWSFRRRVLYHNMDQVRTLRYQDSDIHEDSILELQNIFKINTLT